MNYIIDNYLRIQVDIDPEKCGDRAGRKLYAKFLAWKLDNDVLGSLDGSCGPTGFIAYVEASHWDKANEWLEAEVK